jgi:hypothetical protein
MRKQNNADLTSHASSSSTIFSKYLGYALAKLIYHQKT